MRLPAPKPHVRQLYVMKKRVIAGLRQRGVSEEQLKQQEDLTQVIT